MKKAYSLATILVILTTVVYAQADQNPPAKKKSIFYKEDYGKNIIRFNPMAIYFFEDWRNWTFGYERVLKNNRSVSVNIGQLLLPVYLGDSAIYTDVNRKSESGFTFTADYRFYLNKENFNPRPAPNGVYLGPFLSIYHTQSSTTFNYYNSNDPSLLNPFFTTMNQSYSYAALGLQVGYQFIFWKRFALDMVIVGPSLAYYDTEIGIESNMSEADKEMFMESSLGKFFSKSPVFSSLANSGNFNHTGGSSWFYGGWRYTFNLGYHF